jgi:small subunit ribosomal protein S6
MDPILVLSSCARYVDFGFFCFYWIIPLQRGTGVGLAPGDFLAPAAQGRGFTSKRRKNQMHRYESVIIIDPDVPDSDRTDLFEKLDAIIEKDNGFLAARDEWGMRKLAYEVRKKDRGYYTLLDYCGNGDLVNELERFFKIDDRVMKYLTVRNVEDVDLEGVKAEVEEKQEKEAAKKAEAEKASESAKADEQAVEEPAREDEKADNSEAATQSADSGEETTESVKETETAPEKEAQNG